MFRYIMYEYIYAYFLKHEIVTLWFMFTEFDIYEKKNIIVFLKCIIEQRISLVFRSVNF